MTSPTVPIGSTAEVFPEQPAQVVIEWAEKAGQTAIRGIIDEIRDWLGHPEEVRRIAQLWSDASTPIGQAMEGIGTARADLTAYWEGPAYDAFNSYMDHVTQTITDTQTLLGEEANAIIALRSQITETYNAAISFIGECASIIYGATADTLWNIEQLWAAIPAAVTQALSEFVTNVADLATKATTIVTEYGQGILAISQRASELRPPDDAPRAISEPDNWTVNEANR
jgi:uncharacterized protein YukE